MASKKLIEQTAALLLDVYRLNDEFNDRLFEKALMSNRVVKARMKSIQKMAEREYDSFMSGEFDQVLGDLVVSFDQKIDDACHDLRYYVEEHIWHENAMNIASMEMEVYEPEAEDEYDREDEWQREYEYRIEEAMKYAEKEVWPLDGSDPDNSEDIIGAVHRNDLLEVVDDMFTYRGGIDDMMDEEWEGY